MEKNILLQKIRHEMANRIGTMADTTYFLKNIFHQVHVLQRSISQKSATEHGWPKMRTKDLEKKIKKLFGKLCQ